MSSPRATARAASSSPSLSIVARLHAERGHADHGWLNTYHSFNFAHFYNRGQWWNGFGALRVLNEDRVSPGEGFGAHPHSGYEIFSYIVSGGLKHTDSMGHEEIVRRGGVQFTSAGSGIMHSEFNASPDKDLVHFLQIWVKTAHGRDREKPAYQTHSWTDEDKTGRLCQLISPDKAPVESTITVRNDISVFATILGKDAEVQHPVRPGRMYYLHVVDSIDGDMRARLSDTSVLVSNEVELSSGDGAFLVPSDEGADGTAAASDDVCSAASETINLRGSSDAVVEVVLLDLPASL